MLDLRRAIGAVLVACALSAGCGFSVGHADIGDLPADRAKDAKKAPLETDVVDAGEPDRVALEPADAGVASADAAPVALRAFVTSTQVNGAFGGAAAADQICNEAAQKAGIDGTFRAWISTAEVAAIDRITADGPWVDTAGKLVATRKADLASGSLDRRIDRDEKGNVPPLEDNRAWTGTGANGKLLGPDCAGWTSTTADGRAGEAEYDDARWTNSRVEDCSKRKRLYCFAQ